MTTQQCAGRTTDRGCGEEAVDRFVGHGGQTVVTCVVARHGDFVQELRGLLRVGDEADLTLVNDGVKFVHDHVVQDFAEVMQAQAVLIGVLGNTDAELVALAGVHDTFHIVEPGVDFTLDDRLEVGLHLLARDVNAGGKGVFEFSGIDIRAVHGDLVILDFRSILHLDKLTGGVLGGPELDLHIGLADDFAFERRSECDRDRQFLGLDLDTAQLERLLDGLAVISAGFERARNLIFAEVDVDHDREAQRDCACAGGDDDRIDVAEGIDERGDALLRVGQQPGQIARLHIAEDQRRADGDGDDVDNGGDVMAQRDDAQLETHLDALLGALLDDVADHEGHDALGLIALDDGGHVLRLLGLAQHDGYAGDIAGDQRDTEGTDDGIGHEADAGDGRLLVGVLRLDELQALQDLCADGSGEAAFSA